MKGEGDVDNIDILRNTAFIGPVANAA